MSSADYGERGGTAAATSRATSTVHSPADHSHYSGTPAKQPSSNTDDTDSSIWPNSLGSNNTTVNTASTSQSPTNLSSTATSTTSYNSSRPTKPGNPRLGPNLDLSTPETLARNESLLRDAVFPEWKDDDHPPNFENPEEMQQKDPLGTQIWKLYSRTKSRLPNQERMENLTWRMMAMNLRRREQQQQQQQQQAAYANKHSVDGERRAVRTDKAPSAKQARFKSPTAPSPTPSGIAQQLRKSTDKSAENEQLSDAMNLDDFIVPSLVASPAGTMSPAPSGISGQPKTRQAPPTSIAARHKPQVQIPKNLPPSSMPQTSIPTLRTAEFDYVKKRVRKTSIDERRGVSLLSYF